MFAGKRKEVALSTAAARQCIIKINHKGNRKTINSAFITEVGKGYHRGVFKRETKKRLPIKELYGPSVMQVMSSGKAEEFIQKVFNERFEKELKQALIYGS